MPEAQRSVEMTTRTVRKPATRQDAPPKEAKPPENEPEKDDAEASKNAPASDSEKDSPKDDGPRPSKKILLIGGIVLFVLLIAGFFYWMHARQFVSTDDAYTAGHVHQISPRIAGIVTEVLVDDNVHVEAGAVLVKLDPRDQEIAVVRAQANLAQAQAEIGTQKAKIIQSEAQVVGANAQSAQAAAQVSQAEAQLEKAQLDYNRSNGLFLADQKAVAKSDVDALTAALSSARAMVEGSKASLTSASAQGESARANVAAATAQLSVAQANLTAAEAEVRNAELQLSYCEIVAPVAGKVSRKTVESGQQLSPGQALLAIVPENIWVIANLKETQLVDVRVGQRATLEIDSMPGREFVGKVDSIQEGAGAVFSLLPPDNATGNFTKIVQRVPVKIVFDSESIKDFRDHIVPGLSVLPKIDLESLKSNKREAGRLKIIHKQNQSVEGKK